MTTPRLSVAIPTRQRRTLLEETLRSVIGEVEALGCEIVVSDNASEDGTRAFLEEFAALHPVVALHFQPRNVGLDGNMRDVARLCAGDHVWLLGDDDVAMPGAIRSILAHLEHPPDLLVLQARFTTAQLEPLGLLLPPGFAGATIADPAAAFERAWDRMPFGSFVARRAHLAPELWERYLGTSHAYSGAVWSALAGAAGKGRATRVEFGVGPAVLLRGGEKSWRAEEALVHFQQIPRWFDLLPPLYRGPARRAGRAHQRLVCRASYLLKQRVRGQIDLAFIAGATKGYALWPRLRALAIAALPVSLARRMDEWRTAFHARRRALLARLRGESGKGASSG